MKIYIVGFMGAGKTTVGRELASRTDLPFFDLDELIEQSEQMPVKDIFATHGEPHFRKRERDLLRSTRYLDSGIIATGGGTFTIEDNIQFIQAEGFSVYLAAPYAMLRTRMDGKADDRPLFRDDETTHELYVQRIRFYKTADLTLDLREQDSPPEIVERIILELPRSFREAAVRAAWRRI